MAEPKPSIAVRLLMRIVDPDEPDTVNDEQWDQTRKNRVEAVYRMYLHTVDLAVLVASGDAPKVEHTQSGILLNDACRRAVRAVGEDDLVAAIRQRMKSSHEAELVSASSSQRDVMDRAAELLARMAATAADR